LHKGSGWNRSRIADVHGRIWYLLAGNVSRKNNGQWIVSGYAKFKLFYSGIVRRKVSLWANNAVYFTISVHCESWISWDRNLCRSCPDSRCISLINLQRKSYRQFNPFLGLNQSAPKFSKEDRDQTMMQFKRTEKSFNHKLTFNTPIWLYIIKRFRTQSKGEKSAQFTPIGSYEHFFTPRFSTSIETFQ